MTASRALNLAPGLDNVRQEPMRILRPDGTLDPDSPLRLDVAGEQCRGLYRDMVLARRLDREAYLLQRQGELGLWLSCEGQEAAQVGSARAMLQSDRIFPSYREHAVGVIRGVKPAGLLSQWRGCSHGGWDPDEHNLHLYSLVLGTQTLHATGYAMGVRTEGADEIVLAYVGDGATSQGDTNEALNWATVYGAPIVFFCQNNQWAISTPAGDQAATPLHRRAAGFGLQSTYVDGNDVLAVYAVTRDHVDRVRSGGVPGFIEAETYRMAGHSTSDDPRRYRDTSETEQWQIRDPLTRLLAYMKTQDWADADYLGELNEEADQFAADTRRQCLELPEPRLEDTFRNTLVAESTALRAEREQFTAYQESFL